MTAPGVAEARLTITAPFCAVVVETVGAEVIFAPPPLLFPPLPPPHPRITALDKKIAASITAFVRISALARHSAVPYLTARELQRQTGAQSAMQRRWLNLEILLATSRLEELAMLEGVVDH